MLYTRTGWVWLTIGLVAASAVAHLPGLFIGPSLDAAVFDVVGWRLVEGVPLYAGIWDHKPPGIYVLTVAAHALGVVEPWVATWTISVLATAATGLLVAGLLARVGLTHFAPWLAILAVVFSGQYLVSLGGGLAEQPATVAAAGAVLLASGSAAAWRWAAGGALLAVGILVSVQVVPAGLALVVMALRSGAPRRALVGAAAGGAVVILATVGAVAAAGLLPAAADAVLAYNAAYRSAAQGTVVSLSTLPWTVLALVPLIASAAAGLVALRRWPEARTLALAAVAWTAGTVILLALQGRFYPHYVVPLIVPMAMLAGVAWADLDRLRRRRRGLTPMLTVAGVALLLVAAGAGSAGGVQEARTWSAANEQARAVAGMVRALNAPGDTILVWGNQPYLYRLTERAPVLRYPYLFPLTTPGYASPALIEEMVSVLGRDAPTLIVDAGSPDVGQPGGPPLLIDRPTATEGRELDQLGPLRDFVRTHYVLHGVIDGWPVYRIGQPSE